MKNIYKLYCDGACSGNPGPGGWAFIIINPEGKEYVESAYIPNTTNNRMEIHSCIEGLKELYSMGKTIDEIEIITDSQYLVNTMTQDWRRNKNVDLWEQLDSIITSLRLYNSDNYKKLTIKWVWVKGHSANEYNNRCDKMAVSAYKNQRTKSIESKGAENDSEIQIIFKHIQQYTYSNQIIDVYSFKNNDGIIYYAAEINCEKLVGIASDLKDIQNMAENLIMDSLSK